MIKLDTDLTLISLEGHSPVPKAIDQSFMSSYKTSRNTCIDLKQISTEGHIPVPRVSDQSFITYHKVNKNAHLK